jgi:hypothetical protein
MVIHPIGIVAKCIYVFGTLLSLLLCLLIPVVPPIIANPNDDSLSVGIQDVVLEESGKQFIVRAFYPLDKNHPSYKKGSIVRYLCITTLFCVGSTVFHFADRSAILESCLLFTIPFFGTYLIQQILEIKDNVQYSAFIPEGFPVVSAIATFAELPFFIFTHMTLMKIHCQEDAPISKDAKHIVLFYPGLAGLRATHASICMNAAYAGYFVLCIESGDGTPALSILPDGTHVPYRIFAEYLKETKYPKTMEVGDRWRYDQTIIRIKESKVIMDFLKSCQNFAKSIHLGYMNENSFHPMQLFHSIVWSSTLHYSKHVQKSLFWNSLICHHFKNLNPILMGHSFGGATVMNLMSDEGDVAKQFRSLYPIAGAICHDPWTESPLPPEVKYRPHDTITEFPVLILVAEHFQHGPEYNIVNSCRHVIHVKIEDAGHHSYNEFAFASPIIGVRVGNIGRQDTLTLLNNINYLSIFFMNQIRQHFGTNDAEYENSNFSPESSKCEQSKFAKSSEKSSNIELFINDDKTSIEDSCILNTVSGEAWQNLYYKRKVDLSPCVDTIRNIPTFRLLMFKP